jgi:hypothetical protein
VGRRRCAVETPGLAAYLFAWRRCNGAFGLSAPTGAKVKKSNVKRPKKPFVPNTNSSRAREIFYLTSCAVRNLTAAIGSFT